MIPYLIFIIIALFFVMSYFQIGVPTPKWLKSKNKSKKVNFENLTKDQKYNHLKVNKEQEINRILDKIVKKGYKSLNKSELNFLNEYSKNKK